MTGKPGEAEALDVLAHVLGSGQNSRLYRTLVEDKRIAVNANAGYCRHLRRCDAVSVYATPHADTIAPRPRSRRSTTSSTAIARMGITAEELERAKTRIIADAVYARDNQATMARWYGGALVTGATVEQVKTWPDRVRAVTADRVRDAARNWLQKAALGDGLSCQRLAEGRRKEQERERKS